MKLKIIFIAMALNLFAGKLFAQNKVQMIFEVDVAADLKAQIQITADPSQRTEAEENFKKACQRAQTLLKNTEEPFVQGYLADSIADDLAQAGFADLLLALGDVYVARGEDFNGPWKIPVADTTTAHAQHVFLYKARNVGAATTRLKEVAPVDPAEEPAPELKSVTVFSKEGAFQAQKTAVGASTLGLEKAKKFLKVAGVSRAVLIDSEGKFIQFPEK